MDIIQVIIGLQAKIVVSLVVSLAACGLSVMALTVAMLALLRRD